jgi:hypothetical protein
MILKTLPTVQAEPVNAILSLLMSLAAEGADGTDIALAFAVVAAVCVGRGVDDDNARQLLAHALEAMRESCVVEYEVNSMN